MTLYSSLDGTQAAASQAIITYAVRTTQPKSPFNFITGGGYSAEEHIPASPEIPQVPSWMSPDYPFVAPSEDIQGFVADSFFSFDDPLEHYEAPIRLTRITKHSEGVYSVRFVDKNDQVVFDSSDYRYTSNSTKVDGSLFVEKAANQTGDCIYKHTTWGTYYDLLYWETELVTLKMMVVKTSLSQFRLVPESAEMDARALYQYPKRVRSITVENDHKYRTDLKEGPTFIYGAMHGTVSGGSIQFFEGYNMKFDWSDNSDLRTSTVVTLSASAGAGRGKAQLQCDEEEQSILATSISGISATDDGAIFIEGDPCHTVKGLTLDNDCTPCCKCEDMTQLAKLIRQVEDEYYCIGGKATKAAQRLSEELRVLNERLEKQSESAPIIDYEVAEGNRMYLRFRFIFRNHTNKCIDKIRVYFRGTHMRIYQGVQSGAVDKDYSECKVIDEDKNFISTFTDTTHLIGWEDPILPGQQVYFKGFWKLNTTYKTYENQLVSVTYRDVDTDTRFDVPLGTAGSNHFYDYTNSDIADIFRDYTSDSYLSSEDIKKLEENVRGICITKHMDASAMRNDLGIYPNNITNENRKIVEEHILDPRPDRQRPTTY